MSALPPLNPLHVFTVVARHGSLTRAAQELQVSQSAVSRQVSTLENHLGVQLFRRERVGVSLTPLGKRYAAEIGKTFETIASATARLNGSAKTRPLTLQVYTTFAAKWLLPRLPEFEARHPTIALRVVNAVQPVDFTRADVDIAVQLGEGEFPGARGSRLFSDLIQPVCSPRLIKRGTPLATVDDLRLHRWLESKYRRRDWADWLAGIGRPDLSPASRTSFGSSILTYQAAETGMGIAIGQIRLLQHELATGTLVGLFGPPVERELAYYVLWPKDRRLSRRGQLLVDWLLAEAAHDHIG